MLKSNGFVLSVLVRTFAYELMEPEVLFFAGLFDEYPIVSQTPKKKTISCPIPKNTTLFCCEMLDENVCKCFAFDSNDGLHWTAVGLGIVILLVGIYAYMRYRKNQNKKKYGGGPRMLPMQEIVSQCQ